MSSGSDGERAELGNDKPDPGPTRTNTDSATRLATGSSIAGRYRIRRLLGAGGMGLVYEARDEELELDVALKVLRPELVAAGLERFRRELLLARQVSHPSVVRIHDLGRDGELHFLTMDLVRGPSLRDLLEAGALGAERAVAIARQLAAALAAAHREGIVHRDLKPGNVLVAEDDRAYVSDFGIARAAGTAGLTRTGEVVGTPDYLAPEQARGDAVDHRADLYALGLLLYEMVTGELPFAAGSYAEVVAQRIAGRPRDLDGPELRHSRLRAIVAKLLQGDPRRRYRTADEVVAELERFAEPLPLWRRRGGLRLAAAVLAVVVAGVSGLALLAGRRSADVGAEGVAAMPAATALAVLPFTDETGREDLEWLGAGLAEMLARALAESAELQVVDTERVAQTLRDLGLEPSRLDASARTRLAELFDARQLVTGKVRSLGGAVRADVELLDVAAGSRDRPGRHVTASAPAPELPRLVGELDRRLRSLLEVAAAPQDTPLSDEPAALAAYSEGVRLLRRGEAVDAVPRLETAVAADPRFGAAWHELAAASRALGHYERARDAAEQAVGLLESTGSRLAWEARALQAQLRGDSGETIRILEELVARYPGSVTAATTLAEAHGEAGRLADAVAHLQRVIERDPNHPRAWFLLAKYSILAGDSRRAVDEHLVRAMVIQNRLQSEQGRADVLNAYGVAYLDLGELERAEEHYRQAADLRLEIGDRRGYATTLRNLALVATYRVEYDAAERLLEEALAILEETGDPAGVADLHNELGFLDEERARYASALEHYRLGLQRRRELGDQRATAESLNNVGYAYFLLDQYDNAEVYWRQALELFAATENREGEAHARQGLGDLQLVRGRWNDAARSFLDALELARAVEAPAAVAAAHGALGQVAQLQGRYDAALASLAEALAVLRELEDVRGLVEFTLARAETFLELGVVERALANLDEVEAWLGESGNHEQLAELGRLRARAHAVRGEPAAAARWVERAWVEAAATQSPRVQLGVRLERALLQAASDHSDDVVGELARILEEATRLGNAPLRLRAGEGLAMSLHAEGRSADAVRTLRGLLRLVQDCGGHYAATFRLHLLLAESLGESRQLDDVAASVQAAAGELERIAGGLDRDTVAALAALEPARRLRELARSRQGTG